MISPTATFYKCNIPQHTPPPATTTSNPRETGGPKTGPRATEPKHPPINQLTPIQELGFLGDLRAEQPCTKTVPPHRSWGSCRPKGSQNDADGRHSPFNFFPFFSFFLTLKNATFFIFSGDILATHRNSENYWLGQCGNRAHWRRCTPHASPLQPTCPKEYRRTANAPEASGL